jgi:hypothetical protein
MSIGTHEIDGKKIQLYLLKLKLDELGQLRYHLKTFDFKPNSSIIDDSTQFFGMLHLNELKSIVEPFGDSLILDKNMALD